MLCFSCELPEAFAVVLTLRNGLFNEARKTPSLLAFSNYAKLNYEGIFMKAFLFITRID